MSHGHINDKLFKVSGKAVAVICYLSIVGWIVALVLHGNNPTKLGAFHLRQSLGLLLSLVILTFIPVIGWVLSLPIFILWTVGIYHAFHERQDTIPYIGNFFQENLDSLIE